MRIQNLSGEAIGTVILDKSLDAIGGVPSLEKEFIKLIQNVTLDRRGGGGGGQNPPTGWFFSLLC